MKGGPFYLSVCYHTSSVFECALPESEVFDGLLTGMEYPPSGHHKKRTWPLLDRGSQSSSFDLANVPGQGDSKWSSTLLDTWEVGDQNEKSYGEAIPWCNHQSNLQPIGHARAGLSTICYVLERAPNGREVVFSTSHTALWCTASMIWSWTLAKPGFSIMK
jgi:hypothetical protein